MSNYEYTIKISKEDVSSKRIESDETKVQAPQGVSVEKPKTSSIVSSIIVSETKQAINYTLSNIGNWTGNSRNQTLINRGIESIGLTAQTIVNPALAVAQVSMNIAQTILNEQFRLKKESMELESSRLKNGYTNVNQITTSRRH